MKGIKQGCAKNLSSKLLNSHNLFGRTFGLLYLFLVIFQTRKLIVLVIFFMLLLHGFRSQESSPVKITVDSNNFSKLTSGLHVQSSALFNIK